MPGLKDMSDLKEGFTDGRSDELELSLAEDILWSRSVLGALLMHQCVEK